MQAVGMSLAGLLPSLMACAVVAAPFAYIANERSGSVSVIDAASGAVVATLPVGDVPQGVAAGPTGTRVYVANRRSNDIAVIDTAANVVVATIAAGDSPYGIAVSPDGRTVYVANTFSNVLSVIDATTHRVVGTVAVDAHPKGVAVNPAGSRVYVASEASLAVVDAATRRVLARAPIGGDAYGVAVSPDGRLVYVGARQVTTYGPYPPPPCPAPPPGVAPPPCFTYPSEIVSHRLLVLDAVANVFVGTAELDATPFGVAVDPRGRAVYATTPGSGTLWVVDGPSATVTGKLAVGVAPYGVSVHPDGSRVYVADAYANAVHVVDARGGRVVDTIAVGVSPIAFGAFVGPPADDLAVEYFHRAYGHYFVTAETREIALLDSGAFAGWARTGESFRVRPLDTPGAADVCRFWSGSAYAPKSSHFYTPFDWECAKVRSDPAWIYEDRRFAINLPDASGACAPGRDPLYRLYNDGAGGAPNHRYTTSTAIRAAMIAQGWLAEGSGALGAIGCARSP
jgi:YVTN family beta-propeller protein